MSLDSQIQGLKYSGQILKKLALLQVKIPTKMKNTSHRGDTVSSETDARATLKVFRVIQWHLPPL